MSIKNLSLHATAGALALLALCAPPALATPAYVVEAFHRPGAAETTLWDVNNHGVMVGASRSALGPTDFFQSFVFSAGSFTALDGPAGALSSNALGISDGGVVVGSYAVDIVLDIDGNPAPGRQHGYVYAGGSYTTLDVPGADNTYLRGISPDGRYISGLYDSPASASVGFVLDTFTNGISVVSVPGSLLTIAQGINSSYVMVGSDIISGAPSTRPGFFYDINTGTRSDVSVAGAQRTALRGIDDAGVVAGWFRDGGGLTHGFIGTVDAYTQLDLAGADSTFAEGNNNAGLVVGNAFLGIDNLAFVARPVPEPQTWLMLAGGVALLWRRRAGPG